MRYSLMPSTRTTPHYGVLLLVLLILLVVAPLLPSQRVGYGVEFFFDLVLVTGAYSAAWQSRHRFPFLAFTAVTLAMRWTEMALDHSAFSLASIALVFLWLVYAVGLIVAALFRMEKVDTNAILGAIVAYVLTAVAFGQAFLLIELLQPGSFTGLPDGGVQRGLEDALLYFSYVSITTMGYGGILPVSALARSVASLEGLFGTLYLAVMIARLVGLQSAAKTGASPSSSDR
jgi:hypothetical protein